MKTLFRIAACTLVASAIAPQTGLAQSDLIRTAKSQFRIPFAFEREQYAKIGAQEVQLFLSMDKGENWQHVQSALPTAQKFRYKATRDGEHWFAVRTLDRNRQLHPAGKLTPGLKVLVDTTKPEVALQLRESTGDRVVISWVIEDKDVDTKSLRLEFKDNVTEKWVSPEFPKSARGATEVTVDPGTVVTARLGIQDRAGNVGVVERQLRLGPVAAIRPSSSLSIPSSSESEVTKVQYSAPAVVGPRIAPRTKIQPQPQPETNPLPAPPSPATSLVAPPPPGQRATAAPTIPVHSVTAQQVISPFGPQASGTGNYEQAAPVAPARVLPADGPIFNFDEPAVAGEMISPSSQPMDSFEPRIVNQLQFRLDYAIEDLGPSGVGAVEVYITEDGGKKWWRYGEDMDKKSPVILRVPRDGKYGFAIGVRNGVGVGDPPPKAGEAPHAVVIVDRTPPKARIDKVSMSADGRTLQLQWKTADVNSHSKPVRMEFATTANGPWTPMSDWRADSGKFDWRVPPTVPARVYVRMLVRDSAGNMGQIVYPDAVLVDVSRPRARITNVKVARPRQ